MFIVMMGSTLPLIIREHTPRDKSLNGKNREGSR